MEWCFRRGNTDERGRCEERRRRRKEGIEETLPLVFSQTHLTAVRVSAAELALFHTGAILSSLGYRPPATATWEHLGGDKCLFSVRGRMCTCAAVVSDNTFTTDLIFIPCVRRLRAQLSNQREIWRRIFSSVFPIILRSLLGLSLYFSICFLLQPLLNVTGACTAICWTIC